MIQAFGGDQWVHVCLDRWVGKSPSGRAKFREYGAWDIYAATFKNVSVISATCDDYRAGGIEDTEEQQRDQREGNKIDSDVGAQFPPIGFLSARPRAEEWADSGRSSQSTRRAIWGSGTT
jgi:hypothetical protein